MGAHNALQGLYSDFTIIPDPGSGGSIAVDRNLGYCPIVSAAGETRTLARPDHPGAFVTLYFLTDGGDVTLTVTGGYDEEGNTTLVFDNAGQSATFLSCYDGTAYHWKLVYTDATGGGVTAAEIVVTTNVITAAELLRPGGKTFFLDLAAGFVSTLPAPQLGMKAKFVVKTSPTSTMTVVTTSAANILCGQVLTVDVNSATDPDFTATADQDTLTFVANKAVKGDWAEFECDGTSWYVRASSSVFDGITVDQAG